MLQSFKTGQSDAIDVFLFIYLQIDVYVSYNSNLVDEMSKLTNVIKFFSFIQFFGVKNLGAKENCFFASFYLFKQNMALF